MAGGSRVPAPAAASWAGSVGIAACRAGAGPCAAQAGQREATCPETEPGARDCSSSSARPHPQNSPCAQSAPRSARPRPAAPAPRRTAAAPARPRGHCWQRRRRGSCAVGAGVARWWMLGNQSPGGAGGSCWGERRRQQLQESRNTLPGSCLWRAPSPPPARHGSSTTHLTMRWRENLEALLESSSSTQPSCTTGGKEEGSTAGEKGALGRCRASTPPSHPPDCPLLHSLRT